MPQKIAQGYGKHGRYGGAPATLQAALQTTVNDFLTKNPELATALDLFKVSNEQYKSALEPLQRPEFFVTNSANDAG